jgi:hypothetical protein
MWNPECYRFPRYLAAKKNVDDRALNRHVWNALAASLPSCSRENPLSILDVGGGIGTMIERVVDWNLRPYLEYTMVDIDRENIVECRCRLSRWATARGHRINWRGENTAVIETRTRENRSGEIQTGCVSLTLEDKDICSFFGERNPRQNDLLIAHAFMDLVNIEDTLPGLLSLVKPEGFLYITLNYDGETILLPILEADLDTHILSLYNASMDLRTVQEKQREHSLTGRRLLEYLMISGVELTAAGSSDWIVYPKNRSYPEDEAYFLHCIIHTMTGAITDALPGKLKDRSLTGERPGDPIAEWAKIRHNQIDSGEMIYIAKQFDFLACIRSLTPV